MQTDPPNPLKGYLLILGAAVLWGMIGPFSRLAFREGLLPMEVAFWRAVLTWVFFGAHAAWRRQMKIKRADIGVVAAFGVTGVALFYGAYQEAINRGGATMAAILLYTGPAWVVVLARLFFGERMTPGKIAALAMTFAGVAGVSMGAEGAGPSVSSAGAPAIFFGLAAGFCYSLYFIFGKHLSARYTSPTLFLYMLPLGAALLFPMVAFRPKSPTAWLALVCLAVFCTYGAYYLYYLSLRHLEASRASIAATLEPVVAGVVAFFWWGEVFRPMGYIGGGLVLSAVVIVVWEGTRAAGRAPGEAR